MPSDDTLTGAPPAEAVEVLARSSCTMGDECLCKRTITADCYICGVEHALTLQELPVAARWRLAAWIVAGLEPTDAMVRAAGSAPCKYDVKGDPYEDYSANITAALAAARETRDES